MDWAVCCWDVVPLHGEIFWVQRVLIVCNIPFFSKATVGLFSFW